jgi:hypothetical protein
MGLQVAWPPTPKYIVLASDQWMALGLGTDWVELGIVNCLKYHYF